MTDYPRFLPVGDTALTVEFGDAIDAAINAAAIALDAMLAASDMVGIIETVPSYRSLLIRYDPCVLGFDELLEALSLMLGLEPPADRSLNTTWTIPVVYEEPFARDLREVGELLGLATPDVIAGHITPTYQVYTVGFLPGMPMLGGLPAALHIPRRQSPRADFPAGAVIIGGMQTSILPAATMSGWYILGQTPVRPFDPRRANPFLFRHGDRVRFHAIDAAGYRAMQAMPWDEIREVIQDSGLSVA